ncbi:GlxA family transcriptional regulator [Phyllobacterium myrsinacearum]|uniref:GlxA family transcriptional regulator n=1 Tax=Phyllobacterium myrsinacearum TaxID=28101 RepID=UPI003CCA9C1D
MQKTRNMKSIMAEGGAPSRDIAFMVFPGFQIQDLSGPLAAFEIAGNAIAGQPYRRHVVSQTGGAVSSSCGLEIMTQKIRSEAYDTLLVMGGAASANPSDLLSISQQMVAVAAKGTRRIASVCTGAFILAAAGLLDGRRATTHWKHTAHLQRQFPRVKVERDRIFTRDGNIWTSAGITAGIDLSLAMIEEDFGVDVSHATARMLVVYHRRPGGQSQFSALADMEPESDRIREVLTYMRENLADALSTERLADVACLSPRQFGRAFLAETGETPAKAVERLRVEVARQRVEQGAEPIEIIARMVGFADPERMRRAFIRVIGHPPQSIRRMAARDEADLSLQ